MINVKISCTCLVVSHHWNHHRISSSTDYGTHLANLRNECRVVYVIHDRPAAKQLQFPWTQAFPAALRFAPPVVLVDVNVETNMQSGHWYWCRKSGGREDTCVCTCCTG